MVSLIIGNKGSGKTKKLIALINEAVEKTDEQSFALKNPRYLLMR